MRRCEIGITLLALALFFSPVLAQTQPAAISSPPAEILQINATQAASWTGEGAQVLALQGPVSIKLDRAQLSADRAVVWMYEQGAIGRRIGVALIGNAAVRQEGITRLAGHLYVDAETDAAPQITAGTFLADDRSGGQLYQLALALRSGQAIAPSTAPATAPTTEPSTQPATLPTTYPVLPTTRPARSMLISAPGRGQMIDTDDGTVAIVYSGGILMMHWRPDGSLQTLRAERVVIFTSMKGEELRVPDPGALTEFITGAYLEGDVRIAETPAVAGTQEQRLMAERVYYDFSTDRAILTDAVLHATEPRRGIPLIIRAKTIRQLSQTDRGSEFLADGVSLSTTAFRTPSYSIAADRIYVRRTPDSQLGQRTTFSSTHTRLNIFGMPVFYTPLAGGSFTESPFPLRDIEVDNSTNEGLSVLTEWGLFETFGRPAPRGLDLSYRLDHYGNRGPAGGLNGRYSGGFVTDPEKEPWNFNGEFTSYIIDDRGEDELGRRRLDVEPPRDLRGRALWAHQHILPDGWQVQLRAGYISDPTFLEEWFEDEYDSNVPHDLTAYLKHQEQQEAITLLLNENPNRFITTSESLEEQFVVERVPELGYHRLAESFAQDQFTFHSSNTISRLRMEESEATLAEQGFRDNPDYQPGLPSIGQTGIYENENWRGDFREEINLPLTLAQFRAVPYVFGRYIGYTESPDEDSVSRFVAGTGIRVSTAFWKVNDAIRSELFDINRIRHVVEPSVHVFTSSQTAERDEVFIYDESVDGINDLSAVQMALRQAWQTKRGGPGRWRSVDVVTLKVEGNFFRNEPSEEALEPTGFRGLFFESLPEASVPRDSVNADATWRVSDTTILLGDIQHNLDKTRLATASGGLAVSRDPRVTYFLGGRYIEDLDSTIISAAFSYQLTPKYQLSLSHSYDLRETNRVRSTATLVRKFQGFSLSVRGFYDVVDDEAGVNFRIIPDLQPSNPYPRPLVD